ncbi:hypothetical protein RUND412_009345 [Rhizina undulata]
MPPRRRGSHALSNSNPSPAGATPAGTTTIKIPLNDDNAEKAKRLKRRTILHDIQMNKIVAAATPSRRQTLTGEAASAIGTPKTPRNVNVMRGGVAGDGPLDAVTPLRKVPILANFEEWMKLATDNKINATNSWNFALIDYFHDMSLLKDGEGINFQKASCTLDGCVKIYTSRVDSVATETGKLLSGLADSSSKKKDTGDAEGGEDTEGSDEEDENGEGRKKPKKKVQRSSEATLAKDFSSIRIKKLELEFSVDPLFKKASADFDEGGAKGLLLNHLSIDAKGRIVFDSSDDKKDPDEMGADGDGDEREEKEEAEEDEEDEEQGNLEIDLNFLREKAFPNLSILDNQDICPSLKNFDLGDPAGSLDIPFLKALEERNEDNNNNDNDGFSDGDGGFGGDGMAFGFDDGVGLVRADDGEISIAFGEGGELWATETIADAAERFLSPAKRPMLGLGGGRESLGTMGVVDSNGNEFGVSFGGGHDDILSYFDEALKKNWAGPEHWRIRKIKDNTKPAAAAVRQRKEKEVFEIDFMNPAADVPDDVLRAKSTATINMPKKDWKSKTRHLLPDDKHFNSRQLLRLFLKPKASLASRRRHGGHIAINVPPEEAGDMNEEFWAKENMAKDIQASSTPEPNKGNYDANFFNDGEFDDLHGGMDDDDDFADAREEFSPGVDDGSSGNVPPNPHAPSLPLFDFGSQLVTSTRRVRPEYVQYARVAKKVDVRKLKENMWNGLNFEAQEIDMTVQSPNKLPQPTPSLEGGPRKFTEIMNNLQQVYPKNILADISTSYCFICLLHLANEKGLVLKSNDQLTELSIEKDLSAGAPDEY